MSLVSNGRTLTSSLPSPPLPSPPVPSSPLPSPHGVSNPLHLMVEIVHGIHDLGVLTGKVQEESVDGHCVAQDKPGLCRFNFSKQYSLEDENGDGTTPLSTLYVHMYIYVYIYIYIYIYIYTHTRLNSYTHPPTPTHHTTPQTTHTTHTWAVTRMIASSWKPSLKGKRLLLLYFHF